MKTEQSAKSDCNNFLNSAASLVVFRGIKKSPVVSRFIRLMEVLCSSGGVFEATEAYCSLAECVLENGGSLTECFLETVLQDENMYMLRKAAGEETGELLDQCLANELCLIERMASADSKSIISDIGYDGFLPSWETSGIDFSKVYAERIKNIGKYGYGMYVKNHVFMIKDGKPVPVRYPDSISLKQLSGYERERSVVIENTMALLKGRPANNVLLYGDCGTGKSSTVKAIANEFRGMGLRLIEIKKKQLHEIPAIVEKISRNPLKFILFIDDLSFSEDDGDYAALKAILEGSVSSTADNLVIYATSNRRHLVKETFSSREGDDIHFNDTMQEMLSLSDRFGLKVVFQKPDKNTYIKVVMDLAEQYGISVKDDELVKRAEVFALERGGRSPRAAKQFIEMLKGMEE